MLLLRLLSRVAAGERPLKYFRTAQLLFREHGIEVAAKGKCEAWQEKILLKSAWRDCQVQ